jgi:hypothetical protein
MAYMYKNGQQPLAGYTIKRGVGRGGFGEVYFAVSESGKEVALKLLRGRADVELRGVAHCLNLKHPNLVHIYDQRTDDQGNSWIVMEYVLGESLADVLDRHPQGLPMHLAKDWFLSLSRAVGFLHDHGVLHRDLKPANVFVENGTVKVGDYGLCKSMGSPSERQTRNVGTVHYMAPEVGNGQYGRSVDVYACAAILYEMLVGRPPFDGDSDAEVLIKHTTEVPNLAAVPTPFREVVARGLVKDPNQRFATMTEFARAVEAVPLGGSSVDAPIPVIAAAGPPPLPMGRAKAVVAGPPVATRIDDSTPTPATPLLMSSDSTPIPKRLVAEPVRIVVPAPNPVSVRQSLADVSGGVVKAAVICAVGLIPWALATRTDDVGVLGKVYFTTFAIAAGVMVLSLRSSVTNSAEWPLRLRMGALGLAVGVLAFWLDGRVVHVGTPGGGDEEFISTMPSYFFGAVRLGSKADAGVLVGYATYFAASLFLCRWWRMAARDRKESWTLFHPFAAGFAGLILMFLFPFVSDRPMEGFDHGIVPLLVAAVAVPLASAWTPPPPKLPRKLRA